MPDAPARQPNRPERGTRESRRKVEPRSATLPVRATRGPGPYVAAHRGANVEAAEHTLVAYRAALADGADALECDVRLTRDGHLVCLHDRTTDRTASSRGVVSGLRLHELQEMDFHTYKRPVPQWDLLVEALWEAPPEQEAREVLTFDRLLDEVAAAGRPVQLLVETKHPTRFGGQVEKRLAEALARRGLDRPDATGWSPVVVMSFALPAMWRMRWSAPQVPLVLLLDELTALRRDGSLPTGVSAAGPGMDLVRRDPGYVARVHGHGRQVFVWTADTAADVALLRDLGVEMIITNRPGPVLRMLGRGSPRSDTGAGADDVEAARAGTEEVGTARAEAGEQ